MNEYQKMLMWVYIIGILCVAIIIFVGDAKGQDTASWDWTPTILRDNNAQLLIQKVDPQGDGVAYFTYKTMMENMTNTLVTIHVKQGEVCKIGRRTVVEGKSEVLWTHTSCSFFEAIDNVYKKFLNRPLEELNE